MPDIQKNRVLTLHNALPGNPMPCGTVNKLSEVQLQNRFPTIYWCIDNGMKGKKTQESNYEHHPFPFSISTGEPLFNGWRDYWFRPSLLSLLLYLNSAEIQFSFYDLLHHRRHNPNITCTQEDILETARARDSVGLEWQGTVDVVRGVANAIPPLSRAMDPPRSDRELLSTTIRSGCCAAEGLTDFDDSHHLEDPRNISFPKKPELSEWI